MKKSTKRIPVIISAAVAAAIIIAVCFLINNSPFYADWSDGYTFRGNSDTVLDERISEEIRQILNGDILMRRQYGISASDVGVGIPGNEQFTIYLYDEHGVRVGYYCFLKHIDDVSHYVSSKDGKVYLLLRNADSAKSGLEALSRLSDA